MKKTILTLLALAALLPAIAQRTFQVEQPDFDTYFLDQTLTFYYYRIGNRDHEKVQEAPQPFVLNADLPWSGSLTQLVDPINNGDYRLVVKDLKSMKVIYSRTFNNLFREYRDTPAGHDSIASFEEAIRMPLPKNKVVVSLEARNPQQEFYTQFAIAYDPSNPVKTHADLKPICLSFSGDPHRKIDVAIVAEGYGPGDEEKMQCDFNRFVNCLFGKEPFKSRRQDFNVWGLPALGKTSGITDPNKLITVESAVGASYNTFGNDRYLMTFNLFRLHSLLAATPCDHIIIMANSDTYGGGAIYNFYAISSLNSMAESILPHELGHSIGGLADEYVDESLSYGDMHSETVEPLEPNITSLVDFDSKWKSMIDPSTPLPTPPCPLARPTYNCGPLGLYEGGGYKPKGIYRPVMNCMMNYYAPFCPVCSKALNTMFDLYTR